MIDTREELILALKEAAEIEHGLMIQYLFAALSLKKNRDEGLTAPQQASVRIWEGEVLDIAVSEMGHLGTVQNLLSAIGAGPHFDRPPFPQTTDWYPFPFNLARYSEDALYAFQIFELPREVEPPSKPGMSLLKSAPDPLVYSRVGELYEQIGQGFATIAESELFVGPAAAQAAQEWSLPSESLRVSRVVDRGTALAAIQDIVEDGEGTSRSSATSHYNVFTRLRKALVDGGNFDASRAVVFNPQTRKARGAGDGNLLTDPLTLAVAELFNEVYALMLQMLHQYFSFGGESDEQREALRSGAARMMSTGIRPLSEILTQMPAFDASDPARGGPTFELYSEVETSPYVAARWTMLFERFDAVAKSASSLGADLPRVAKVAETLSFIRRSVASAAKESVR